MEATLGVVDEVRIEAACKGLKLPGVSRLWRGLAREATQAGQSHAAFLAALLEAELQNRRENVLRQRLRDARFPVLKTLDTFDFTAQPSVDKGRILSLARGDFVRGHETVLHVGKPGSGKSHLGVSIGLGCLNAGYRVRFTTAVALANKLVAAAHEHHLPRTLRSWRRFDLVILDELGFLPLSRDGGHALFQFCADRYETGALLVTTNLEFSRWTEVFGDAEMTAALLDRLLHHAHIIEHTGESYRFRETMRNKASSREVRS